MNEMLYTENHEWIRIEDDTAVVGVTDYAQDEMGDITFVEVPNVGMILDQGEYVCAIESIKTAVEICAPIGGEIVEVNSLLDEHPELINNDPLGEGWLFKLGKFSSDQLDELMDMSDYDDFSSRGGQQDDTRINLADVNIRHTPDDDEDY